MSEIEIKKYGKSIYVVYTHEDEKLKIFTGVKTEAHLNCLDHSKIQRVAWKKKFLKEALERVVSSGLKPTIEMVKDEFYFKNRSNNHLHINEEEQDFFTYFNDYVYRHVDQRNREKIIPLWRFLKKSSEIEIYGAEYNENFVFHFVLDKPQFRQFINIVANVWENPDQIVHMYVRFLRGFIKNKYPEKRHKIDDL